MIEDNIADVGLVREALMEHNVEADLVVISDGDYAIQFIDNLDGQAGECPDLVILDLNLPKRPGRDVLESIRKNSKCQEARVAILSSSDAAEDKADALKLGAHHYIRKPLRLAEFLDLGGFFKQMLAASRTKDA